MVVTGDGGLGWSGGAWDKLVAKGVVGGVAVLL